MNADLSGKNSASAGSAPLATNADGTPPGGSGEGVAPISQEVLVHGATAVIPQRLLTNGEVVILAIKPSLWFIMLTSGRWLAACLVVILAAEVLPWLPVRPAERAVQLALLVAAIRLLVGSLEWLGRVYVLTDRRVMRLKGVTRIDLFECPLARIQQTELSMALSERMLFCGTILFYTAGTDTVDAAWRSVARPAQVYRTVIEAMEKYRRQNP